MSIIDKLREFIGDDEVVDEGDHSAPEHEDDDGHLKSWSAHDLADDELVDDDWIAENTREVK